MDIGGLRHRPGTEKRTPCQYRMNYWSTSDPRRSQPRERREGRPHDLLHPPRPRRRGHRVRQYRAANPKPQALACWGFSVAKLKRCRVMDVLQLVATSTDRDGTISGPVVVLTPDGA